MSFDPTKPVEDSPLDAAEMRNQFNALKALVDDLKSQLAPLLPVLNRDASGQWTLAYAGPTLDYWLVWARWNGNVAWNKTGEMPANEFPTTDDNLKPDDNALWWQIKICGENDDDSKPCTSYSNIVSVGPVPEA